LSELGQPAERILRTDFDLGKNLPETGRDIVTARGRVGDAFRGLEPLNLGRGAIISAGDSNVTILRAPGLDCLTPVGVMLGYNVQGPLTDTTDIFVQATLKWGVGGEQHEATVDVGRGTQIRLAAASFIEVLFHYLPDDTTTPPRTGPDIMGIALLGYGTPSFRPSPARFTQRLAVIPPGANSATVAIPKFAQSFGVIGETGSIAGWTATLLPNLVNDGNGHQAVAILADGQDESQWYVPNGFRAIRLTNNTANGQAAEIVFSLML